MKKRPSDSGATQKQRRRIFRLPGAGIRGFLIFLLLGVILNVAVAWGCVLNMKLGNNTVGEQHSVWHNPAQLYILQLNNVGCVVYMISEQPIEDDPRFTDKDYLSIAQSLDSTTITRRLYFHYYVIDERLCLQGWPLSSLWCSHAVYKGADKRNVFVISSSTNLQTDRIGPIRAFPYVFALKPLWTGFLFNTLFYATPLWLLFPGRYMLRRHRRIRRGLCGQCGYMVAPNIGVPGASPNCTECGAPLPEKLFKASSE